MEKAAHGTNIRTMCSSRWCLICLGLFLLSLFSKPCNCTGDKQATNELYDELKPNQTVLNLLSDEHEKQVVEFNCSADTEMTKKRNYFISKLFSQFGDEKGLLTHEGLDKMLHHLGFKDDHSETDIKHLKLEDHDHGDHEVHNHEDHKDHDHDNKNHTDNVHDNKNHTDHDHDNKNHTDHDHDSKNHTDHDHEHHEHDHLEKEKHSDEEGHNHRHERSLSKLEDGHSGHGNEKLFINSLLEQYGLLVNSTVTQNQFVSLCPGFVYMLLGLEHTDHNHLHETHEHIHTTEHNYPGAAVWGFSCLSVIVISLVGLFGVAVIPIMQKVFYNHLLQFLVALAVGALSGDAMLHLIPHAFQGGHSSHDHGDSHDTAGHIESVMKGLCGLTGIYFFFLIERLLTIHTQQKRKRNKGKSKYVNNRTVYNEELGTSFIGNQSANQLHDPDCEDMVMGIHPGHKALKNFAEETHNKDCHKLNEISEENHKNCDKSGDEEEPQLVLSHSHGVHGHSHCHKVPKTVSAIAWMVILGDGIHNFSDGLAIGAAFANSVTGGLSTSIAVFCHELPHEIGDFAVLLRAGMTVKQALVYNCVSSVLAFIGMIIGVFIGNIHGASLWIFLGVAGMFLYIALVDMLPQVSDVDTKKGEHPHCHLLLQISGMILGGGIMLLIAIFEHDMMNIL